MLKSLQKLLSDDLYKKLEDATSTGKIKVWAIPDNTYIVPTFEPASYDSPTQYVHIVNGLCTLPQCKEKKSKTHTLVKKEVPPCVHTVLVHSINNTPATQPSTSSSNTPATQPGTPSSITPATQPSTTKVSIPKLNRDLTVGEVIRNISRRFPTLTNIEKSGFVQRSRRYVETLHSNKAEINRIIRDRTLSKCSSCTDSNLVEWPFKPKQAFLLSMGHLMKIEIPVKICNSCKTVYYPGNAYVHNSCRPNIFPRATKHHSVFFSVQLGKSLFLNKTYSLEHFGLVGFKYTAKLNIVETRNFYNV